MIAGALAPLAGILSGAWASGEALGEYAGVGIDSRVLGPGRLFFALPGARTHGQQFLAAAHAAGAAAAIVEQSDPGCPLPQLVVADSRAALGRLAQHWRRRLSAKVGLLTGSNGKTTVKNLTATILAEAYRTHATSGNRNNEIGLPLTLLDCPADAEVVVLEAGAGAPGDIAYLSRLAEPDAALVNNVGPAHLERLGSLAGVAAEKGSVVAGLKAGGTVCLPADDALLAELERATAGHRIRRFGLAASADVRAEEVELGEVSRFTLVLDGQREDVALALPGLHNVHNALAACALAQALGAGIDEMAAGLALARPEPGRLQPRLLQSGALLVDDSYNANPASVRAGIAALAGTGRLWLALGDMAELGAQAEALHFELGQQARAAGVERLHALGPLSAHTVAGFGPGGVHHRDLEALAAALRPELAAGITLLVKGSRAAGMERLVRALLGAEGG